MQVTCLSGDLGSVLAWYRSPLRRGKFFGNVEDDHLHSAPLMRPHHFLRGTLRSEPLAIDTAPAGRVPSLTDGVSPLVGVDLTAILWIGGVDSTPATTSESLGT